MLKDAQRRRFDVVIAWAIDRLGRSLIDLLGTVPALETCGVFPWHQPCPPGEKRAQD
jgi:DNA invertase Pin-like site-specific DNA recombinase